MGTARSIPSQISVTMPGRLMDIAGRASADDNVSKTLKREERVANDGIVGKRVLRTSVRGVEPMAAV